MGGSVMTSLANAFKLNTPTPVLYKTATGIAQSINEDCSLLTIQFDADIDAILLTGDEIKAAYGTDLTIRTNQRTFKSTKDLSLEEQIEVARLKKYIDAHWSRLGKGVIGGVPQRELTIESVQRETFDTRPMSPATLSRILKGYRTDPGYLARHVRGNKAKTRRSKINPDVKCLALEFIDDYYLTREPVSRTYVYDLFEKELRNDGYPESQIPTKQTFYNWCKELDPLYVASRQLSPRELTKLKRNAVKKIIGTQILERVEVDAVHLACGLVDSNGKYLGSATVYVVLDCYSRSVLGIHVQVGRGETTASVIDSYRHAFLPKTKDYGTVNKWTQFGTPQTLINDGGAPYKSIEAQTFKIEAGISATIAPTGQGWRKPFVERFFGTLRKRFAEALPGYCGRMNDERRKERSIEEEAILTLEEFRTRLVHWIVDEYHQTPHSGLGNRTPQSVWDEQACIYIPTVPSNMEKMQLPAGEILERTISGEHGHLGVVINNVRYNDYGGELKRIAMLLKDDGKKTTVQCNYNSNDISSIAVVNPYTDEVLEVSNTEGIPEGTPYVQYKSERIGSSSYDIQKSPEPKTRTKDDTARIKQRQEHANSLKRRSDIDVVSSVDLLNSIQSKKCKSTDESLNSVIDTSIQIDEDVSGGYDFD